VTDVGAGTSFIGPVVHIDDFSNVAFPIETLTAELTYREVAPKE